MVYVRSPAHIMKEGCRPQPNKQPEEHMPHLEGGNGVRGLPRTVHESAKPPPEVRETTQETEVPPSPAKRPRGRPKLSEVQLKFSREAWRYAELTSFFGRERKTSAQEPQPEGEPTSTQPKQKPVIPEFSSEAWKKYSFRVSPGSSERFYVPLEGPTVDASGYRWRHRTSAQEPQPESEPTSTQPKRKVGRPKSSELSEEERLRGKSDSVRAMRFRKRELHNEMNQIKATLSEQELRDTKRLMRYMRGGARGTAAVGSDGVVEIEIWWPHQKERR